MTVLLGSPSPDLLIATIRYSQSDNPVTNSCANARISAFLLGNLAILGNPPNHGVIIYLSALQVI